MLARPRLDISRQFDGLAALTTVSMTISMTVLEGGIAGRRRQNHLINLIGGLDHLPGITFASGGKTGFVIT